MFDVYVNGTLVLSTTMRDLAFDGIQNANNGNTLRLLRNEVRPDGTKQTRYMYVDANGVQTKYDVLEG